MTPLVMCKFGQRNGEFALEVISELLTSLVGRPYTPSELSQAGERIYNLERLYNMRSKEVLDVLPDRLFEEDLEDELEGGGKLDRDEFRGAIKDYHERSGLDESGLPTPGKLSELGLDTV